MMKQTFNRLASIHGGNITVDYTIFFPGNHFV